MNKLTGGTEGQGYKELSIFPSTYPKGSKILEHLLPAKSGTVSEVTKAAPALNARELIWRSTHPGDGEGLVGIMPSGQTVGKVEASTAVLALLDTPSHFFHLRITNEVRDALRDVFYLGHNVTERNVGLKGMSDKLVWRFPEEVGAIQACFASQIRWIVMPFLLGENLTITEHPNIEGYRIDQMGKMNYESMLHYDYSSFMGESSLREPIMVMPDGAYIGQEHRSVVSNSDEDNIVRMASELMMAVREAGTYPSDVCLQIECGIPKSDAERAYLFQVRIIGPKYTSGTGIDEKDALLKWQFGPTVPSLKNEKLWDVWELNNWHGTDGLGETLVTLHSNTLYPLGYPPAYAPVGGMKVGCDESQFSFGHNHTRLLNWAARGGKYGPGIYEQFDKRRKGLEGEKNSLRMPFPEERKASSVSATDVIDENLLDRVHHETYITPAREKELTPQERAIIHENVSLFEEKEIPPYEGCMKLLDEVFELCAEIPSSYFGDSYGGSRLELHKYTPRKKLVSDADWWKSHNYERPHYAIDYDRPEFDDEASAKILFNNSNFRPEISFRYGKSWLTINLAEELMHLSSDNWFILNDGGCMTGTIVYGYCPKDANGTRSIAHAQHVFGKECQKTPEYYRYQNPICEPIGRMEWLKQCLIGKPEKPPFTGTKYQNHSPETLKSASDLLGPMLLRLRDALDITLQTDPRTFLRHHLLWRTDLEAHVKRTSKK